MKKLIIICSASGVGKSTIKEELKNKNILDDYVFLDDVLNWWEYKDTEKEDLYYDDCLKEAVKISKDKNIVLATCMNPYEFYKNINVPQEVTSTFFIGLFCSSKEIEKRLKARPIERMCGSDEFIIGQIEYNNWFKKNSGKFQLFIDNTSMSIEETVNQVADFIKRL